MYISAASVLHKSVPLTHQVKTSFGIMTERHAVFLLLTDERGNTGIGESWINFPSWGAYERKAAYENSFIPFIEGADINDIPEYSHKLFTAFKGPAVQSGTIGPLIGALCGIELALWDLKAQREGIPVSCLLSDNPRKKIRVYGSGLNSPLPFDLIDGYMDQGISLFKLKLGFGEDTDRKNLAALKNHLNGKADYAVDINRKWDIDTALSRLPLLEDFEPKWIEEPLKPDCEEHLSLFREQTDIPVSGGENIMMPPGCDIKKIADVPFDILQPDITKYTPLHVALSLVKEGEARGKRMIPHFLGSAPGQAASLHLGTVCREGLVELDVNRNPLRTNLFTEPFSIEDGSIAIPDKPGFGWRLK